jgi:hypothetical protein
MFMFFGFVFSLKIASMDSLFILSLSSVTAGGHVLFAVVFFYIVLAN